MNSVPPVTVAVGLAVALEWLFREPPARYHPVALFGRVVEGVDARPPGSSKLAGAVVAVALPTAAAVLVYLPLSATAGLSGVVVAGLAGLVLWSSSSFGLLLEAGERVIEHSDADPEAARESLPALVGRDPGSLSPALIRSAAVESLAENLSDGLVAPVLAFVLLSFVSLPAAAAAAAFVKAVNTMDSMLGYPGDFGWGSARLDDAVMFVPARVTAALLGPAAGDPDAPWRARRYARKPASPNAGWPMGTIAAALDVRLEKPGAYVLNDISNLPTVADGEAALAAVRRAGVVTYILAAAVGVVLWL
ncbi:CobD/CbiB family cobalamin biosynthesis protein [Natronomonas marina]|uniref:CobD/CbiB family cobalamin biosynthesis protein n=1 Tax=Natronomonas marina TaxID=2961939 RepID=UPI0020C9DE11|nr:CobD/CbiB family cobalamin biosynthesis protein [Natronomonas marina]